MPDNGSTSTDNTDDRQPRQGLFGMARDLALASVGLVSVLSEDAQVLYRRSIERGRVTFQELQGRAQQRLRLNRVEERGLARRARLRARHSQLAFDDWRAAFASLNLPSAAVVDDLERQIAELEAKIDQLAEE